MTRRGHTFALGAGVAAGVGGALALWVFRGGEAPAAATAAPAAATAEVERRDLVVRETLDGELGFADARRVVTSRPGTVTSIAREGAVLRRGEALYAIDGKSTYLMYGSVPAWRALRRGVSGIDVEQLERNLVALGYDPGRDIVVDGRFDSATEAAVKRWEDARGAKQDGVVELGDVVFLPGARRVGQHLVLLGGVAQPGSELVETSSLQKVVTVKLEAGRQDLVREGDIVDVELPGGRRVRGRVVEVGRVAEQETSASGEEDGEAYVTVTIRLAVSARGFDKAPVDVHVATETKRNVLVVPVEALLALAGGGYAVETVDSSGRHLVRVDIGTFADGYVEISGRGIRDGMRVVVPR